MSEDRQTDTDSLTDRLSRNKRGLAALSFAESTVAPVPLETIVVPLMIGHPKRSIGIAVAIFAGCLVGASLFFVLGLWLKDPVVLPAIEWLGVADSFDDLTERLDSDGLFWTVFLVSFSPVPMQIATLGAGATGGSYLTFIAAIAASRGLRYFGLAILAQILGKRIEKLEIPKRTLTLVTFGLLVVIYAIYKLFLA